MDTDDDHLADADASDVSQTPEESTPAGGTG